MLDALISIRDLFLTAIVLSVAAPLWLLPWRAACRVARLYGWIGFLAWGIGRRAGMINLRRAYGESMTRRAARAAVATVFANLAQSLAEALQFVRRFSKRDGWQSLYRLEDPALAERLLADPRPKIFVTGHLGSWEVAVLILQRTLGAGAGIARRVDNRWLDRIVKAVRLDSPSQWIEKAGGAEEALRRLRAEESVVMLVDENGGKRGPWVDFFGRPASTRKTPALLSMMTGCPIVIGAAIRENDGRFLYRLAVIESVSSVIDATAEIQRTLESWIRDAPLQWRWIHWRWRTRPDGSEERYGRRELLAAFADDSALPGIRHPESL